MVPPSCAFSFSRSHLAQLGKLQADMEALREQRESTICTTREELYSAQEEVVLSSHTWFYRLNCQFKKNFPLTWNDTLMDFVWNIKFSFCGMPWRLPLSASRRSLPCRPTWAPWVPSWSTGGAWLQSTRRRSVACRRPSRSSRTLPHSCMVSAVLTHLTGP